MEDGGGGGVMAAVDSIFGLVQLGCGTELNAVS